MAKIDRAEEKWGRKALAGVEKFKQMARQNKSLDEYVKGVAQATGLSESQVRSSFPAQNYKEFQQNVDEYARQMKENIQKALDEGKWSENYKNAFTMG